jgi:hypothetical protein
VYGTPRIQEFLTAAAHGEAQLITTCASASESVRVRNITVCTSASEKV